MLGAINGYLGLFEEAIRCGRQAVDLQPNHAEARYNLGQAYTRVSRYPEAEASYREAVRLKPDYAEAWDNLGYALQEQGKTEEAAASYRKALQLRPDFAGTQYLLAAVGGAQTPPKAPPDYVRGLFDNYADRFEKHLVEDLEYRIPQLLNSAIRQIVGDKPGTLDILDLGCGTGLCAPLFRDLARKLVGIDLAPRMIEKARGKNLYDELRVGDIAVPDLKFNALFDLIIAADVFPYVGDLAQSFEACSRHLKVGGLFAFSIEAIEGGPSYVLRATNRYAQSSGYVRDLAQRNGFVETVFEEVTVRKNKGEPVGGYIFVLRRES